MTKPTLPQGTRDFGPEVVRKRNFILNTIREVFELYGFQPLETPAMENLETLTGKYGDEGDKLIFKILNNGLDNPAKEQQVRTAFDDLLKGKSNKDITERALKYDLTIPFARYVAMNHNQLNFPFKRYQVQPVWRADRPQKGRYREFYQCDADVVGSKSVYDEVELAIIYDEAFRRLGIKDYELRVNNRKILAGLADTCEAADKVVDISIAIDKLDKIGIEKVKAELTQKGFTNDAITIIEKYLQISGTNEEIIEQLYALFGEKESRVEGLKEIAQFLENIGSATSSMKNEAPRTNIKIDPTLARGLNYYTGIIFEAKAPATVQIGSIGGGGRYDDLTGMFGVPGITGVGISLGVDRIYDVMEELGLFPRGVHAGTQVLFFNLGVAESKKAFELLQQLRDNGISGELFHEASKFDKQFKYAEKKNIPFIIIIGEKELSENICTIKNLKTGKQESIPMDQLINYSFKNTV